MSRDSGRGFATYISDVLSRCKLQKTILHCLLASVYDARERSDGDALSGAAVGGSGCKHLTEAIMHFNQQSAGVLVNNSMQLQLLGLVRVIIVLEEQLRKTRGEPEQSLPADWQGGVNLTSLGGAGGVKYAPARPLVQQTMFVAAVMSALKQQHQCQMHQHVISTLTSTLPYMGRALSHVVVCVVLQLCKNLDTLAAFYSGAPCSQPPRRMPPDHLVSLLEGLTHLAHYCLLDQQQDIWVAQHTPSATPGLAAAAAHDVTAASSRQLLSGLAKIFSPYASSRVRSFACCYLVAFVVISLHY